MPRDIANGIIELVESGIRTVNKLGPRRGNKVGENRLRQLRRRFPPNTEDILAIRTAFNRVFHPRLFGLELGDGSFMDNVNLYLTSAELMPSEEETFEATGNIDKDTARRAWRLFFRAAESGDDTSKWAAYIEWEHKVVIYAAPIIQKSLAYKEHLRKLGPERLEAERRQREEILAFAANGLGSLAWVLKQLDKLPELVGRA